VKTELRTKYYDDFDIFKDRIDSIVCSTDNDNKMYIDSLVTDKVQLFDEIVNACNSFPNITNLYDISAA
jgi:uncharacterized protein YdcH (DUF465 family)